MDQNHDIPQSYRFGEFHIDTTDETLYLNDEKLHINRRTFGVFRLLIERKGEIVSKQEFFDTVWEGTFVEDNSLTVAITMLRKLLKDDPKQPKFIENLPRKGYRFIAQINADDELTISPLVPGIAHVERKTFLRRRPFFALLTIALVSFVGVFAFTSFDRYGVGTAPKPGIKIQSIAVLPFENQEAETEYLSDGITESITNTLAVLPGLRVINRESAFQYKKKEVDILSIQREFNVDAVVTGRMSRDGDKLDITTDLTDTANGQMIWSKRYEGKLSDVFSLQQSISRDLSGVLKLRPTSENKELLAKSETDSPEAYQLYIKGQYFWNRRTQEGFAKGVDFFRQAIALDPTYAKAYLGLANCYASGSFDYIKTDKERTQMVLAATKQALEIDPNLAGPYATQALMKTYYQWDWSGAENDYKLAIDRDPNFATARHWYAEFLAMQGRFDESIAEYDRAFELDPRSMAIRTDLGLTYYYAGEYDRAVDYLQKSKKIEPAYSRTYKYLAEVYQAQQMFEKAIDEYEKFREREGDNLETLAIQISSLKSAFKKNGASGYWQFMLNESFALGSPGIDEAALYLKLGQRDMAFQYLEKAYSRHQASLVNIKVKHEFDEVRDDPRYVDMVRRVGLQN